MACIRWSFSDTHAKPLYFSSGDLSPVSSMGPHHSEYITNAVSPLPIGLSSSPSTSSAAPTHSSRAVPIPIPRSGRGPNAAARSRSQVGSSSLPIVASSASSPASFLAGLSNTPMSIIATSPRHSMIQHTLSSNCEYGAVFIKSLSPQRMPVAPSPPYGTDVGLSQSAAMAASRDATVEIFQTGLLLSPSSPTSPHLFGSNGLASIVGRSW